MQTEIVITIYFVFILGIGFYSSFKIKTPGDYYVAGKRAGITAVAGSLLATILGGSAILGTIELSQKTGWAALWFLFCASFGLLMLVPVSRYVKQFGNFTLPELLRTFYGKKAELISSIIIPIAWLGIVAAQIIAAAKILSGLGNIGYQYAAVLAGTIFILYTLLGGQLSILKTDALQSVLIITGLIALIIAVLQKTPGVAENRLTVNALFNENFNLFDLLVLILTYSVTFVVGPDIYSRIFCAKNERTASKSIVIVAALLIPVSFGLSYLGVYSQNSNGQEIISFASTLLPPWAYGLFIAALLSAVMSSADTTLLTSSLILNEIFTDDLNTGKALKNTRWTILIMGTLSIIIALFVTSIIQSLLFALTFFSGAFVVPTLAGLLNLNVVKERVIYAILAGGLIALSGKVLHDFQNEVIGNVLIVSSYMVNFSILFYRKQDKNNSC